MCALSAKRRGSPQLPEAGYTIIELMVVVGIIAFAAMVGVPSYLQWNNTAQLKQATTELLGEFNLARLSAMNRNRAVTVTLAVVNNRVTATFVDGSGAQVMPIHTMVPLVTGFTGGPVTFSSLGMRVGGGAGNQLVTLTNSQALTYSIAVTPAGKSTWCARATCP